MTTWSCYRALLTLRAPLHIGWHELGLIQRTRYYIPARAVWGMLVAGLAPRLGLGGEGAALYTRARGHLDTRLRFTALFPTLEPQRDELVLRPRYLPAQGLMYGSLSPVEFESRFVFSQTSAALAPQQFSALEGALHESEYLTRFDSQPQHSTHPTAPSHLSFLGYVFFTDDLAASLIEDVLRRCAAGADRRYGWGELALEAEFKSYRQHLFGAIPFELAADGPILTAAGDFHLAGHLPCDGVEDYFEGDLEAVSGRDWTDRGPGQRVAPAQLCWAPGSRLKNGGLKLGIEPQGLWRKL